VQDDDAEEEKLLPAGGAKPLAALSFFCTSVSAANLEHFRIYPHLSLPSRHASHELARSSRWTQYTLLIMIRCCLFRQAAVVPKHVFTSLDRATARRCLARPSFASTRHTAAASNSIMIQAAIVKHEGDPNAEGNI